MPKIQKKIGSLGDSYGRGGEGGPPRGGGGGTGGEEKCLPHFPKFFSPGDVNINLTVIPRDSRSVSGIFLEIAILGD